VIFVDILLPRGTLAKEPIFHRDDTNEALFKLNVPAVRCDRSPIRRDSMLIK
jgi:hypothetical protein